jgi:hypothetical protein
VSNSFNDVPTSKHLFYHWRKWPLTP